MANNSLTGEIPESLIEQGVEITVDPENEYVTPDVITIDKDSLNITFDSDSESETALEKVVEFTATEPWEISIGETKATEIWVSVSPMSGDAGDVEITITLEPNDSTEPRTTTVSIVSGDVTIDIEITQDGCEAEDSITIDKGLLSLTFDAESDSTIKQVVEFTASTSWDISMLSSVSSWLSVSPMSGDAGDAEITIKLSENESYEKRTATVTITAGEATAEIAVTQLAKEEEEEVDVERQALIDLYNATGGDNWLDNTNWCSDAPLGERYGVTTDDDGAVVKINLCGTYDNYNTLKGAIPESIGDLVNLTYLNLSYNNLSGEVPQSVLDLEETCTDYYYLTPQNSGYGFDNY